MIKFDVLTMRQALANAEQMPENGILYFSEPMGFGLDKKMALLTAWNWEGEEDPPQVLTIDGVEMTELLPVDPFQQIVFNAVEQLSSPAPETLLAALKYYYEFDAFIEFDEPFADPAA
jgi:hypothetical protein